VPDPGFHSTPETNNKSSISKKEMLTNVNKHNGFFQNSNNRSQDNLIIQNNNNTNNDDALLSLIRNKLSSDSRDAVIGLRVPQRIKLIWEFLDPEQKRVFRDAFVSMIDQFTTQYQRQQVVNINVNINMVKAEAKAVQESRIEVSSEVVDLIVKLYNLRNPLPQLQREIVEKLYRLVKQQVVG